MSIVHARGRVALAASLLFCAMGGQQAFAMSAACAAVNSDWASGVSLNAVPGGNQEAVTPYSGFDPGETISWVASSGGVPDSGSGANSYFTIYEQFPGFNQFVVANNDAINFSISGNFTFAGSENIEVILQADNRTTPAENNTAFARVSCTDHATPAGDVSEVSAAIESFVQTRQSLLSAAIGHPGLMQRRLGQAGTIELSPQADGIALQFAQSTANLSAAGAAATSLAQARPAPDRFNAWIEGTARLHAQTDAGIDRWGSFALLSAGADYLVSDTLLAGFAVHGDWLDDVTSAGRVNGQGFLVGPYLSAELIDGLFFDASLLYGRTGNDVDSGGFTGTFDTSRVVVDARLSGLVQLREDITLIPNIKAFYITETADGYTLSDGTTTTAMPGFTQDSIQLSAGGRVEFTLMGDNDATWKPYLSADLGLDLADGTTSPFVRLGTGLSLSLPDQWTLTTSLDATLVSNGPRSLGAKAKLAVGF